MIAALVVGLSMLALVALVLGGSWLVWERDRPPAPVPAPRVDPVWADLVRRARQ